MDYEVGLQRPSDDDRDDHTGYKRKARLHQSNYRAETLQVGWEEYGNYLRYEDANEGRNYYDDFRIYKAVRRRFPEYDKQRDANMLRSEHIPFNFFVPLKSDLNFAKEILNEFFEDIIDEISKIEIEYAPKPKKKYLDDGTAFDVYIEFTHVRGGKGVLGIEVKYTEQEYQLIPGSKEESSILDMNSRYHEVTRVAKLFREEFLNNLPEDRYRQIWRNQLLAESMTKRIKTDGGFEHAISAILFPKGNEHFMQVTKEYFGFLTPDGGNKFKAMTYEEFIDIARNSTSDDRYLKWLDYLSDRYIVE